jgi:hypothetical protein
MLALFRLVLQVVLFFMLLSVAIGLGSTETGLLEKGVLVVLAGALIWLASFVRRIGARSVPRSS